MALVIGSAALFLALASLPGVGDLGASPARSLLGASVRGGSFASFGWLLLAAQLAALVDELLFRGLFQRIAPGSGSPFGRVVSAALVAGLFGASVGAFVPLFGLGFLLGWIFEVEGSLLPVLIARASASISLLLLMRVYPGPWSSGRGLVLGLGLLVAGLCIALWWALGGAALFKSRGARATPEVGVR